MHFYIVDDAYVAHLKLAETRVPDNYNSGRAFVGVVLAINGFKYFAPLTSYKPKQDKIKNGSLGSVKLHERGNEQNKLGMIQLNNMIPVPDHVIQLLDMSTQPAQYLKMLNKQHEYIKTVEAEIQTKAQKLYKLVCIDQHATFLSFCCNFRLLEQALDKFGNEST